MQDCQVSVQMKKKITRELVLVDSHQSSRIREQVVTLEHFRNMEIFMRSRAFPILLSVLYIESLKLLLIYVVRLEHPRKR